MQGIEERLAEVERLGVKQLRAEWQRLHGVAPPPDLGRSLLARGIAWKLQERVQGGLSPTVVRELARLARQLERSGDLDMERQLSLKTGTRLIRQWHQRTCQVTVLDDGFLFEDRRYASLTQIARHVTGAKWSGPRFFGLVQRSRGEAHG